ncbi:MAG: hypothetical protein K6G68_07770 [Oscillospiraceae bacterium]|nr:hypothetical protein [Oscillospiraceae bacterium]
MEVLNKALPLILTAIMSMNLSGCDNTGANGSQPAETSAAHVEKSENVIITDDNPKTNEQQYKELSSFDITDWHIEDITSNIIIDGNTFSLPYNIDDLPADFSVLNEDKNNDLPDRLKYKDDVIAIIRLNDNYIERIDFYGNAMLKYNISVGKITYDSSYNDVMSYYGLSNHKNSEELREHNMIIYLFPKGKVVISTDATYYTETDTFSEPIKGTIVYLECVDN